MHDITFKPKENNLLDIYLRTTPTTGLTYDEIIKTRTPIIIDIKYIVLQNNTRIKKIDYIEKIKPILDNIKS